MVASPARRSDLPLVAILAAGILLRLSTAARVFRDGIVEIDGIDGWYHLRRALLALDRWPRVPSFDPWLNAPYGANVPWPPLFDGLLATLALPWRNDPRPALELIGAFLPVLLGGIQLILLYLLVRDLWGRNAARISTAAAAVLPGVVRYTLVGALDHDPFYEVMVIAALLALWRRKPVWLGAILTVALLGWSGALVLLGILLLVTVVTSVVDRTIARSLFETLAAGAGIAAIALLPFVASQSWQTATIERLSLLHEATLLAVVAVAGAGAVLAGNRTRSLMAATAATLVVTLVLAPRTLAPFLHGVAYAGGDDPILRGVAEAQPLLALFGSFDLRPLLVRLTLVPILGLLILPFWLFRSERRAEASLLFGWLAPVTVLALLHSRFSFDAAVASAAFAGPLFVEIARKYGRPRACAAALVLALPILTAYIPVDGWRDYNFYARPDAYRDLEMDRITTRLSQRASGVVYAPWSYGHWILWNGRQPVVVSPMLSVGQSNFAQALRLYFTTDSRAAEAMLQQWQVRYVIVCSDYPDLRDLATAARIDAASFFDPYGRVRLAPYLQTVPGRLALYGAFGPFVEIDRSRTMVDGPLGRVPRVRVYELRAP